MAFSFSSPFEQYFDKALDIKQVDIPTQTGRVGALPGHVPTLGCLAPGRLSARPTHFNPKLRFDDRLRRQHWELLRHFRLLHHQRGPHRLNHRRGGLPRFRHRQGGRQPCPCRRSGSKTFSKSTKINFSLQAKANSGDEEAKIEADVLQALVDAA